LSEAAKAEEKRIIMAAAAVGKVSTMEVRARIKTNIERSELPEARTFMRKPHALAQAVQREKKKLLGIGGAVPKTPADIKAYIIVLLIIL
jgi:hypothetical protein